MSSRPFGFTQKQIEQLQESWRDIPDAWLFRANHDKGMGSIFLVEKLLTIRQYERLQQMAVKKKQSVEEMAGVLHRGNILTFVKPEGDIESYEAIFEKKLQNGPTVEVAGQVRQADRRVVAVT